MTEEEKKPQPAAAGPAEAPEKPDPFAAVREPVLARFPQLQPDGDMKTAAGFIVPAQDLLRVARGLKAMPGVALDYLSHVTGVDYKDHLQVVYYLMGTGTGAQVVLKVNVPAENPEVDSVTSVWPGADWHEREAYDLLGVRFRDHPNLKRILLWEGYEGYPLRKNFVDRRPKRERQIKAAR